MRAAAAEGLLAAGAQVVQAMSEQQRADLTPLQLRRKAREFALKTTKAQSGQFQRCRLPLLLCAECGPIWHGEGHQPAQRRSKTAQCCAETWVT